MKKLLILSVFAFAILLSGCSSESDSAKNERGSLEFSPVVLNDGVPDCYKFSDIHLGKRKEQICLKKHGVSNCELTDSELRSLIAQRDMAYQACGEGKIYRMDIE